MKRYWVVMITITMAFVMANNADAVAKKNHSVSKKQPRSGHRQAHQHPVKVKHHRSLATPAFSAHAVHRHAKKADMKAIEETKPLDLAVPFKDLDMVSGTASVLSVQEKSESPLFEEYSKRAQQDLQLKGQVVMSQEPEADKRKSVDGAGIMINLRR